MKSFMYSKDYDKPQWWLIDASGMVLGRLASEVVKILKGKNKPIYTPHADMGDFVVVTNLSKIIVTGNKESEKTYHIHSGYIGNMRHWSYKELVKRDPRKVFEIAIKGMLSKNPLGRAHFRKLKCYAGPQHEHKAQNPTPLTINSLLK
ncbi:MAG: 50S ribosomal protein L13 [Methylacidiphilales bacterium]|nr:50S ribosomal protein L13 [Candidatus Methylacidiphilales bacterium]